MLKTRYDALWRNLHLATMVEGYGIVEHGALAVKDGRIAWVGREKDFAGSAKQVVDGQGGWLTPGLVDCHTHLVYAGDRAGEFARRQAGASYAEIAKAGGGILSTVKAVRAASDEELLAQSEKRLLALMAEGVTTVEIKSGYGLDTENEIKILRVARLLGERHPVRVRRTFLGAHALPPEYESDADGYMDFICKEMLPAVVKAEKPDAVDGFCESIGFSREQIGRLFEAAKKHGLPVKLHAEQLSDRQGAALAAECGALSADHLEYANEPGIRAMAEAGTVAVLLPGAFYFLKETKKPPVELLRRHGVPIALATDCNPGSSPVSSLLLMLNMGAVLFGLTPQEALAGVTCHAAKALGLQDEVGTLEVGKAADLALWDVTHPDMLTYLIGENRCRKVAYQGRVTQAL